MSNIILTAVDNNPHYMEGLKVFLASFAVNAPKEKIRVHLINCPVEYEIELLKIYSVQICHIRTDEKSAYRRNYIRHGGMLKAFEEGYNKVAWMDNDAIVRKSLDGFWDGVESGVIKIRCRFNKLDENKFQTGIYALGEPDSVKRYLRDIIKGLYGQDDWKLPQLLMYKLAKKLKRVELPKKYNDSKFSDNSVIWHCKQSHFNELKYQKEYKKYYEIAHVQE